MGTRFLIDTNIAIYLLNGTLTGEPLAKVKSLLLPECNLSIVTKIEVLGWKFADKVLLKATEQFIFAANTYRLSDRIADQAILIRQAQKIKLPDAIIAATALVNGFTLITRNTGDFSNISGLNVINPMI